MNSFKIYLVITAVKNQLQESWSSGYGRRFVFEGCGFESRRRLLDG